jgi:hypothetical protein
MDQASTDIATPNDPQGCTLSLDISVYAFAGHGQTVRTGARHEILGRNRAPRLQALARPAGRAEPNPIFTMDEPNDP